MMRHSSGQCRRMLNGERRSDQGGDGVMLAAGRRSCRDVIARGGVLAGLRGCVLVAENSRRFALVTYRTIPDLIQMALEDFLIRVLVLQSIHYAPSQQRACTTLDTRSGCLITSAVFYYYPTRFRSLYSGSESGLQLRISRLLGVLLTGLLS